MNIISEIKEWARAIFIALVVLFLIFTFVFQKFKIPTNSMDSALLVGDFIIVNKLIYGPRIPNTPLSIPFIHRSFQQKKSYLDYIQLPYWRLPGYDSIQRNDIIVFNYPIEDSLPVDKREHYIKRCVGMPGDRFFIEDKLVFIDNFASPLLKTTKHIYYAYSKKKFPVDKIEALGIKDYGPLNDKRIKYQLLLTYDQLEKVKRVEHIHKIEEATFAKGVSENALFPENHPVNWDIDNVGPFVIPAKGIKVELTPFNIAIYKRIIEKYERHTFSHLDGNIRIDGKEATHYTFEMNYYFMMGDNRHNSADSRFWGFMPEDHIIGKATYIFWSMDYLQLGNTWFKSIGNYIKSVRWTRLLKEID